MSKPIVQSHLSAGIKRVRRELAKVQAAYDAGNRLEAYAAAERAQEAAFAVKAYVQSGDTADLEVE